MKASAFRRWPVAGAYSPEQTTRLTGGSDSYFTGDGNKLSAYTKLKKLGVVGNMELSGTVNNGDLTLVAKYKMKFWFNLFKTEPLDLSQKVKVHLWGLEDY